MTEISFSLHLHMHQFWLCQSETQLWSSMQHFALTLQKWWINFEAKIPANWRSNRAQKFWKKIATWSRIFSVSPPDFLRFKSPFLLLLWVAWASRALTHSTDLGCCPVLWIHPLPIFRARFSLSVPLLPAPYKVENCFSNCTHKGFSAFSSRSRL